MRRKRVEVTNRRWISRVYVQYLLGTCSFKACFTAPLKSKWLIDWGLLVSKLSNTNRVERFRLPLLTNRIIFGWNEAEARCNYVNYNRIQLS